MRANRQRPTTMNDALLKSALSAAVPLWIDELSGLPWDEIQSIAHGCSQHIAEHGDNILYRSKKEGKTAEAFNALAKGIARAAFAPGGVTIFGMHFEARILRSDDTA